MRPIACVALMTFAIAGDAGAQRLQPAAARYEPSNGRPSLLPTDSTLRVPTLRMAIGGTAGAVATGLILWYGTENCYDYDCFGPILLSIALEGVAVPAGAYAGARRGGWFGKGTARSYLIELLGVVAGSIASSTTRTDVVPGLIAAGAVAAQIIVCVDLERRALKRRSQ